MQNTHPHQEHSKRNYGTDRDLVLQKLFDTSPMMMGIADLENDDIRHISDNAAAGRFFGMSSDLMEGKLASELGVPSEYIKNWIKHYKEAESSGTPSTFEYSQDGKIYSVTVFFVETTVSGHSRFSYVVQDITELRAELEVQKTKLDSLLKASPIGIAFLDRDLRYEIINPVLAAMNGLKPEDHLGHTVSEVIPEMADSILPLLKDVLENRHKITNWEYALPVRNSPGKFQSILANYFPVIHNDEIIGVGGAVVDLTFKQQTDKDIRNFFAQAPVPMFILNGPDHQFTLGNPLFEKLVRRNVIGKTVKEIFSDEESSFYIPLLDQVFRTGKPHVGTELPLSLGDKESHWINLLLQPYRDPEGIVKGLYGVIHDVTEFVTARKVVEQNYYHFQELANLLPQIIWIARPDGHVYWYNQRYYDFTGLPKDTDWDDQGASPIHPEDITNLSEKWKHSLKTGEPTNVEFRIRRHSDGEYRWHLSRGLPVRDPEGKIVKWIGSNTDIHEQKVLLEKYKVERDLREQFVNALTHDLRTPLTAAKISAQMIPRKREDPDAVARISYKIIDNMNRADLMIRDLLDSNRIKAGETIPLEFTDCNLNTIIQETVEELSMLHGDRFIFKSPKNYGGLRSCSGVRRILENLCNNAVKYGSAHDPIRVDLYDDGNFILLTVHNQGNPIPVEDQAKLFDQFRRAPHAVLSNQKGWGIGLTLVKGIAEAHGGSVSVDSSINSGTTFIVKLPL